MSFTYYEWAILYKGVRGLAPWSWRIFEFSFLKEIDFWPFISWKFQMCILRVKKSTRQFGEWNLTFTRQAIFFTRQWRVVKPFSPALSPILQYIVCICGDYILCWITCQMMSNVCTYMYVSKLVIILPHCIFLGLLIRRKAVTNYYSINFNNKFHVVYICISIAESLI